MKRRITEFFVPRPPKCVSTETAQHEAPSESDPATAPPFAVPGVSTVPSNYSNVSPHSPDPSPCAKPPAAATSAWSNLSPVASTCATPQTATTTSTMSFQNSFDIGLPSGCKLSDGERLKVLDSTWKAPEGFQWPYSERMDGGKLRRKYLGPQHLSGVYIVFSYSLSKRGLFCKPCVIFAPNDVRGVKLGRLVQSPLQKFAHLTGRDGYLTSHLSTKFHENSIARAQALRQTTTSKAGDIAQQMKSSAALQRVKNCCFTAHYFVCGVPWSSRHSPSRSSRLGPPATACCWESWCA